MTFSVVDTNVPIVANNHAPQASLDCVSACIRELETLVNSGTVVLDNGNLILNEYISELGFSGQPGPGSAFVKWIWDNQGYVDKCEKVDITENKDRVFTEFPDEPALKDFHKDDRKFVAVALKSANNPEILNAVDSDWWNYREVFMRCGIRVRFLCRQVS
ncbi:MAG: hypothetical protein HZA48_09770 [Planctomycetes bacterium]|nr:hypothetical protein [Planctomycetota bacterium]